MFLVILASWRGYDPKQLIMVADASLISDHPFCQKDFLKRFRKSHNLLQTVLTLPIFSGNHYRSVKVLQQSCTFCIIFEQAQ